MSVPWFVEAVGADRRGKAVVGRSALKVSPTAVSRQGRQLVPRRDRSPFTVRLRGAFGAARSIRRVLRAAPTAIDR